MASVVEEVVQTSFQTPAGRLAESRVLLTNVSWALYQTIAKTRGGRSLPRLSFLEGTLELMSPSYLHELLAKRFDYFVLGIAWGLGGPCRPAGSTLWERAGLERGKEPDACFYLANAPTIRGLTEIDLEIHPPPDLAIEIELSRPIHDILRIYSGLGVPELWRTDGKVLRFLHLGPDGSYVEREKSRSFPMLGSREAFDWIMRDNLTDEIYLWLEQVKDWARRDLAARIAAPPA
jgi:Uma2 family endonuclease